MASVNNHETRINALETKGSKLIETTKNLAVATIGAWVDTGINLDLGNYVILFNLSNSATGGKQYSEHYSGSCSFFQGDTTTSNILEIELSSAGHAPNNQFCTLGYRVSSSNASQRNLLISSNHTFTSTPINFKIRRIA